MSDIKQKIQETLDTLKQQRDELNVQAHLAEMEVKEELEEWDKKWDTFKVQAANALEAAEDSGEEVGEALALLGDELKHAYQRIKNSFK